MPDPEDLHRESDLPDLLKEIAYRKARAAESRLGRVPDSAEKSRQVYQQACAEIAAPFVQDGFRYAKSGPHLTRSRNGFLERIAFQSSHNNVAGEYVSLSLFASLRSKELCTWRKSQPTALRRDDWIGGGQLGNLRSDHPWLTWNLADPASRAARVSDAVAQLQANAYPFFRLASDLPALGRRLEAEDVPGMELSVCELFLCRGLREAAARYLNAFLGRRPDLRVEFEKFLGQYREAGIPSHGLPGYAAQAAALRLAHGLA